MMQRNKSGFTIVELLIVIVVIGILAAITIVSYSGVQQRAGNVRRTSDINNVAKLIALHYGKNGYYPVTGASASNVRSDSKCAVGSKQADWVPGIVPDFAASLPQSDGKEPNGPNSGCYKYWSDGESFVLSAWLGAAGVDTQGSGFYQRAGFREAGFGAADQYLCNHPAVGGVSGGVYSAANDRYKKSYTVASTPLTTSTTNPSPCSQTPPPGA